MMLKPCPFCGNNAKLFAPVDSIDNMWAVVCQHPECNCNARILYCHSLEEATGQWNRRIDYSVEIIEALIDAISMYNEHEAKYYRKKLIAGEP